MYFSAQLLSYICKLLITSTKMNRFERFCTVEKGNCTNCKIYVLKFFGKVLGSRIILA